VLCICSGRRPSSPSPARMIYRAAISRPRTASSRPTSASARNYRSGFLGRLSQTLGGTVPPADPIAFTDALPLAFEGAATVPEPVAQKHRQTAVRMERQARILSDMYGGHHLEIAVRDGLDLRQEVAQKIAQEMLSANRSAVNTKGLRTRG